MKMQPTRYGIRAAFCCAALWFGVPFAFGQIYINEIYFDPPGSGDLIFEYIELRGEPNASLADHYLIFLENEASDTADPGEIDAMFDLGGLSAPNLGANGYLTLRQTNGTSLQYTNLNPLSNNLKNSTGSFSWGASSSTVGWSDDGANGVIENSGFTAMLIKNNGGPGSAPFIPTDGSPLIDLDENDDVILDSGTILDDWTVLDSIGVNGEASDSNGFLYAPVNFSPGTPEGGPNNTPGSEFVDVGFEIESIGRWGDSTGSTSFDWHANNLTDNQQSGYEGLLDFRQSGEPHGIGTANQFVETSQGVPYGADVISLGSPNFYVLDGDYTYDRDSSNFDGVVNGRDVLNWARHFGFGGDQYATREHGDGSLDRTVNGDDLAVWEANFGSTHSSSASASICALGS